MWKVLLLCVIAMVLSRKYRCPRNCECQVFQSVCNLLDCDDPLDIDAVAILINGRDLCPEHFQLLRQYPHIRITLYSSYCRDLDNCE